MSLATAAQQFVTATLWSGPCGTGGEDMLVTNRFVVRWTLVCLAAALMLAHARQAHALERLCDSSFENCRNELLTRIQAEQIAIDVGAWFFEDSRFSTELIKRKQAGVPVRLIADPDSNKQHPLNGPLL